MEDRNKAVQEENTQSENAQNKKKEKPKKSVPREILEWVLTILAAVAIAMTIRTFLFELVRVDGHSMDDTLADGEIMFVTKTEYTSVWKLWPWESDPETCDEADRWNVYGDPSFHDVVICRYPERGQTNFVKRVVGLPGDTVAFEDGYLYRNGEKQPEEFLSDNYRQGLNSQLPEITVPRKGDALTLNEDGYLCVGGKPWRWANTGMITGVSAEGRRLTCAKGALYLDNRELTLENGVWMLGGEAQADSPLTEILGKEFLLDDDYYFVCGDHRNNSNDSRSVGPVARSMIIGHVRRVIFPFGSWRGIE